MLQQLNFKPSRKLCSYWSSLPQGSIYLGKTEVPALFSEHRSFFIEYLLLSMLLAFEGVTIYMLDEAGINPLIMIILAIVEVIIAILPLVWQGNQNLNKAYVKAQIFVNSTLLKWSNPEQSDHCESLKTAIKNWKRKKNNIGIISFLFSLVILGFGYWKFYIYYNAYGSGLFFKEIGGRFVLISIFLGVIVHTIVTKTVFLHLLMKARLSKELKANFAGDPVYIDVDGGYTHESLPLQSLGRQPLFRQHYVQTVTNSQSCRAQLLCKWMSNQGDNVKVKISINSKSNAAPVMYTNDQEFSEGATFLHTKLLRDADIQSVMDVQRADNENFEREIIAAIGKQEQLKKIG
jgi:hypothetical protein